MKPRVSVIVPMWNSAATIAAALESLLAQTLGDWEAIVVDDGSTDQGAGCVHRYSVSDRRVRLVSQSNKGLSAARNAGLEVARGEFVQFLDADDTLPPESMALLTQRAIATEGAAFGGFAWICVQGADAPFEMEISCDSVGLHELLERNRFPAHAHVVARELIGGFRFDESLCSAEDWDFWLRLAASGVRWAGVDRVVANYHLTPGSMSRNDARMLDAMMIVARSAFATARVNDAPGCDASRTREQRVRTRLGIECATAAILTDDTARSDRAAALLRSAGFGPGEVDAASLAVAAHWGLPHAARRTPAAWHSPSPLWLLGLDKFWRRCEHEGWIGNGGAGLARAALAEQLVEPWAIVDDLIKRCLGARRVEVIGFGRNGRRLARELRRRGVAFEVRDDAISQGVAQLDGSAVTSGPIDAPISTGAAVVVTPEADEVLLRRLPAHVSPLRWSLARRALGLRVAQELVDAWPSEHAQGRAA